MPLIKRHPTKCTGNACAAMHIDNTCTVMRTDNACTAMRTGNACIIGIPTPVPKRNQLQAEFYSAQLYVTFIGARGKSIGADSRKGSSSNYESRRAGIFI